MLPVPANYLPLLSRLLHEQLLTMRSLLLLFICSLFTTALSAQLVGDTENGLASYYSDAYDGAETAYKVIYHKDELVAAHRQYPQNSVVQVRNVENGKTVKVKIIDKGPFIRGRVIEVSERAAAILGMLGKETVPVEVTLLSTPDQPASIPNEAPIVVAPPVVSPSTSDSEVPIRRAQDPPAATPSTADRTPVAPPTSTAPAAAPKTNTTAPSRSDATQSKPTPTVTAARSEVKNAAVAGKKDYARTATFAPGTYKIEILSPPAGGHGVQVGSFKDLEKAMDKITELQKKWFDNILIQKVDTSAGAIYKIILGPFDTQKSALRYASDLKKRYKIAGFTVEI